MLLDGQNEQITGSLSHDTRSLTHKNSYFLLFTAEGRICFEKRWGQIYKQKKKNDALFVRKQGKKSTELGES